ncbi:hypothetical protein DSM106972_092150 [Dulcicalothrix desertica PCC 7102]|uniref:Uncharacterized protein n=1 Tax=Dulcicalothrix desertica PCC 7102 TaxID=232991 RepID=A0A433UMA4_9CYAN|nr:hypothetical protein [Dulcicalothrix desertica]RUS94964.1 hypothetical protein DSM106972_092150 [Dulcicalothrix desertica PCC 7102]TWH62801.1 hypothetical protein CAL7102_00331 [Dulcicalothrix desertica PCC 7102]
MKNILMLGLLAIVACSQTNQDISQNSTGTETTTATTTTSQVQEAAVPVPQVTTPAVAPVHNFTFAELLITDM